MSNNDAVYDILYRNMLSSEQQLAYSWLCCIDRTADSKLTQLLIFIHHAYVFIHETTITKQKTHKCVNQFQFFYVLVSIHEFFIALRRQ
jgi:hypothetical protein